MKYFEAFEKGLLTNLNRKSIEPIALSFLDEKEVRGMQQFFMHSTGWEENLRRCYKEKPSNIGHDKVNIGKRNTQKIERIHLSLFMH